MPTNPLSDIQISRLGKSLEWSYEKLEPFRRMRMTAYQQYVGAHYGERAAPDKVPVGLIAMMCDIYLRSTVARRPRIMVRAQRRDLKPEAATIEYDLNKWLKDLELHENVRKTALEAILSLGVMKVGVQTDGFLEIAGDTVVATRPFALPVALPHMFLDMAADRWEDQQYMGDRYRVSLEAAQENPNWKPAVRDKLVAATKSDQMFQSEEHRSSELSMGSSGEFEEFEPFVEIIDVFLPKHQLIVQMPADGSRRVLAAHEWDGPEIGPYHPLWFKRISGNVMPVAPVINGAFDLHTLVNSIFRKLARQTDREKVILGYRGQAKADAERIVNSSDGEAVLQNDGQLSELRFGGPQSDSMAFYIQAKDLFSWTTGNLDILGGLAPMAGTLGQEEMLASSSSKLIADMQDSTVEFVGKVVDSLRWYHWTDPIRSSTGFRTIEGTDIQVESRYSPEVRRGDILDYEYEVDIYSMQHQTPQSRLQTILQMLNTVIMPAMPIFQQQGITLNSKSLVELISKYTDIEEFKELLSVPGLVESTGPGSEKSQGARKNQFSRREYVRRNVSGQSSEARNRDTINQLIAASGKQRN